MRYFYQLVDHNKTLVRRDFCDPEYCEKVWEGLPEEYAEQIQKIVTAEQIRGYVTGERAEKNRITEALGL